MRDLDWQFHCFAAVAGYDAEIFEEEEEFCLQMQGLQGLQNPLQNGIHGLFQNAKLL